MTLCTCAARDSAAVSSPLCRRNSACWNQAVEQCGGDRRREDRHGSVEVAIPRLHPSDHGLETVLDLADRGTKARVEVILGPGDERRFRRLATTLPEFGRPSLGALPCLLVGVLITQESRAMKTFSTIVSPDNCFSDCPKELWTSVQDGDQSESRLR